MRTELEFVKAEAGIDDDDGKEFTTVWLQTLVDGKYFQCQIAICDPANYTDERWEMIGKEISHMWDAWEKNYYSDGE